MRFVLWTASSIFQTRKVCCICCGQESHPFSTRSVSQQRFMARNLKQLHDKNLSAKRIFALRKILLRYAISNLPYQAIQNVLGSRAVAKCSGKRSTGLRSSAAHAGSEPRRCSPFGFEVLELYIRVRYVPIVSVNDEPCPIIRTFSWALFCC